MNKLTETYFDKVYDELGTLNEATLCEAPSHLHYADEGVDFVVQAIGDDKELNDWWEFAKDHVFSNGKSFGSIGLRLSICHMLDTFKCFSYLKGGNVITIDDLNWCKDSKDEKVKQAARYVVNRAVFSVCGDIWADKVRRKEIAGFRVRQPERAEALSAYGRDVRITLDSNTWDFRDQQPRDFSISLLLSPPEFETLCKMPCDDVMRQTFEVGWYLSLNNRDALPGWNLNKTFEYYNLQGCHPPMKTSFHDFTDTLVDEIDKMTYDLKRNSPKFYRVELSHDVLNCPQAMLNRTENDILDAWSWFEMGGPNQSFDISVDKRNRIAPKAINDLVVLPVMDMIRKHQWTTDKNGDHVIKFDIDIPALKKYTKDNNLPLA